MKTEVKTEGLRAAERLMKKPGYVVIGLLPGAAKLLAGAVRYKFAGSQLGNNCCLEITGETNRADWTRQVMDLFGTTKNDKNPIEPGQKFYRCVLRKIQNWDPEAGDPPEDHRL